MNIDKKAEAMLGMNSNELLIFLGFAGVGLIIALILYAIFLNIIVSIFFFGFMAGNGFIAVKLLQKAPDRFFKHFMENRKMPKIYMPGVTYDNKE